MDDACVLKAVLQEQERHDHWQFVLRVLILPAVAGT